jgi:hypothetical protein
MRLEEEQEISSIVPADRSNIEDSTFVVSSVFVKDDRVLLTVQSEGDSD